MSPQGTGQDLVLLIEDDPDHAYLFRLALDEAKATCQVTTVNNGEAGLDYLLRRGAYADPSKSPRPRVVVLDLRLPQVDGLELLREVRASVEAGRIPVVVLTSSAAIGDVAAAYDEGANSYLVKPMEFPVLIEMARQIDRYWVHLNEPAP